MKKRTCSRCMALGYRNEKPECSLGFEQIIEPHPNPVFDGMTLVRPAVVCPKPLTYARYINAWSQISRMRDMEKLKLPSVASNEQSQ